MRSFFHSRHRKGTRMRRLLPVAALLLALVAPASAWATSTTWNPSDMGSGITLSNGNLTAQSSSNWYTVRATTSHPCCSSADGKYVWEITATTNDGNWIVGMLDSTAALNVFAGNGSGYGVGWHENGINCYNANTARSCTGSGVSIGTGTLYLAYDATTGYVYASADCKTWTGGGTPDAGTAQIIVGFTSGHSYFPAWSGGNGTADEGTINTNPSLAGCTGLTTYVSWDSTPAPAGGGFLPLLGVGH
jgi:hypothetical protein